MMPVTPVSTVIEMFYPTGFAHDYHWTSMALGMRHFAVWNDTCVTFFSIRLFSNSIASHRYHTHPNKPDVAYPDGFQGTEIPVYAPTVVQIIEERIAGKHPISII